MKINSRGNLGNNRFAKVDHFEKAILNFLDLFFNLPTQQILFPFL